MSKQKKHSSLSNILFAIGWQFRIAPVYSVYMFIQILFAELVTLFEHTFLLAYIVDCVEKGRGIKDVLYFLVPVAIAVAIKIIGMPYSNAYISSKVEARIKKEIHLKLYEKAVSMEIAKYDDSAFYNDFVWAMQKAPEHI